jgi:hypothetical protein
MNMNFYKNLKVIAIATGLMLSTSTFADPILVLADKAENYTQTETGYTLHFELSATAIELDDVKSKIQNLSDRVQMTSELLTDNKYKITYTVDHQNQPEYVYKMLLASGFKGITFQGENQGLNKIIDILYNYQK